MTAGSSKTAIEVDGLSKLYRRTAAGHRLRTLKSALLERSLVHGLRPEEAISALDDISFTVAKGESVGVIGSNGSGKSTLLKTLTGILKPTAGTVRIDGRVAALIELGAGFHPEISGRENIYINGAVLGISRREIRRRYDDIVEFSGLAEFIDEPVKNYSSGMYVRLGFAVAIHTDPDVLMVDEVLAVGDEAFSHRCLRRIEGFLRRGKTLVLVSHSLSLIEDVCDRVLWLEGGRLKATGSPRRVADAYRASVAEAEGRIHRETKEQREQAEPEDAKRDLDDRSEKLRWGSGEAEIEGLRILVGGEERYPFAGGEERYPLAGGEERYNIASGEAVTFEIVAHASRPFADFVFGIAVQTPRGVECWGTNTDLEGYVPERLEEGRSTVRLVCPELRLGPGEYLVDVAVHARDGTPYDYRRRLASFTVTAAYGGLGVYFPRHRWSFAGGVAWREEGGGTD